MDTGESTLELTPKSFDRLARYVTSELGIKMPESKLTMVQSRLYRRVRELRLESLEQYSEYFFASANAEERDHFINAITTNKTDFFREPHHFEFLTGTALPARLNHEGRRPERIKVWSAGCSTGEEPYTLAMVLDHYGETRSGFDFGILATDISTHVLEHARDGIYQAVLAAPVPAEFKKRYLLRSRDPSRQQVRIDPGLRRRVEFERLNFMDRNYGLHDLFDFIFFRNVLIYFERATQETVINRMCRNLAPGGYLFAGHSESLAGLDVPLRQIEAAIFRKPAE
jgi:chemotaxis protein methyltransferase CheR